MSDQGKLIGEVTHCFRKLGVGIIELSGKLQVGDNIRIVGGGTDFEQKVDSMEIDRKEVTEAKKGEVVGLKVEDKVREGYKVYKV